MPSVFSALHSLPGMDCIPGIFQSVFGVFPPDAPTGLAFFLFALSGSTLLFGMQRLIPTSLGTAGFIFFLAADRLSFQGHAFWVLLAIALCLVIFYKTSLAAMWRNLAGVSACVLTALLCRHYFPGLLNWRVGILRFSDASIPWAFWINFPKPIAALLILVLASYKEFSKRLDNPMLLRTAVIAAVTTVSLGLLAYHQGIIVWDPGLPPVFLLWLINNVLLVCVAETILFQVFLQTQISKLLGGFIKSYNAPHFLSVLAVAGLFGLNHMSGSFDLILSALAGGAYALTFLITGSARSVICVHAAVNIAHALLFSYPLAASFS